MFRSATIEEARRKRDEIISDYRDIAEEAMQCLDMGFECSMTVMALPQEIRKTFRTSNHIERLNKELKRRAKVIGIFPNEESLVRLMGAVLMEINDINQAKKHPVFYGPTYQKLKGCERKLIKLAEEQAG